MTYHFYEKPGRYTVRGTATEADGKVVEFFDVHLDVTEPTARRRFALTQQEFESLGCTLVKTELWHDKPPHPWNEARQYTYRTADGRMVELLGGIYWLIGAKK